jgi:hypothetical protein
LQIDPVEHSKRHAPVGQVKSQESPSAQQVSVDVSQKASPPVPPFVSPLDEPLVPPFEKPLV